MICHRNRILLAVFCCPAILALWAQAQITGAIQQQSPLTADSQQKIATAVAAEVQALTGGDAKMDPKMARDKLVNDCDGHGGVTASHDYQTQYATELVKNLTPMLDAKNPLRVRLNAAIVIGRAAERLEPAGVDDQFAPLVTSLLQDKQEALVIWGAKAAKYLIASAVQAGANANALQDQLLRAVKAFPESGAIVDEAYSAFTLTPLAGNTNVNVGQLSGAVLPHLVQLIDFRASQYAAGTVPPSPVVVKTFSTFVAVTASPVWLANVPLRNDLLKSLGSLACAQVQLIANGNNDQDLIDAAKSVGDTLSVMGRQIIPGGEHLNTAGMAINGISAGTQPNSLTDRCNDLNQALKDLNITPAEVPGAGTGAGTTPAVQAK
ncbi:MAG TPA: hypothetical protein VN541_03740 [Tepidisphaeraceae bacterium]|nr:hypothetical protein [Tepidisphaeraceae bacterium]